MIGVWEGIGDGQFRAKTSEYSVECKMIPVNEIVQVELIMITVITLFLV